jgi:hypothetical protein
MSAWRGAQMPHNGPGMGLQWDTPLDGSDTIRERGRAMHPLPIPPACPTPSARPSHPHALPGIVVPNKIARTS